MISYLERSFRITLAWGVLGLSIAGFAAAQELRVSGQILDVKQRPIAEAAVELRPLPNGYALDRALLDGILPEGVASVRSQREGRFELAAPAAGMWWLTVRAPGYAAAGVFLTPLLLPTELRPIILKKTQGAWVQIEDGAGQPVVAARVVLDARPGRRASYGVAAVRAKAWPRRQVGYTDEQGRLRLQIPESGKYLLQVLAAGFAPWSEDFHSGPTGRIVLRPGTPRSLVVRRADGQPAAEALVQLAEGAVPLTLTDGEGRATVYGPAGAELGVRVLSAAGESASVTLGRAEAAAPLEIRMEPGATLAGRILSGRDRTPVAGAVVWHLSQPTFFTTSAANGQYRLHLSRQQRDAEDLRLAAAANGYFPVASQPPTALTAARHDGRGPLLILPEAAIVLGVVVDDQGQAVVGAAVRALSPAASAAGARSGSDGSFVLAPLPPGRRLRLQASRDGYAPTAIDIPPIAGRRPFEVRLRMLDGRFVFGTLVDTSERPIAGAAVRLTPTSHGPDPGAGETRTAASGEHGRFELRNIAPGTFDLVAEAPGFAPARVPGIEIPEADRQIEIGTLVLVSGARLEGEIRDTVGNPLADAEVRVTEPASLPTGASKIVDWIDAHATTDTAGRFAIEDLVPGQPVDLRIDREGYAPATLRGIRAPTEDPLTITLEGATRLRGQVLDEHGKAVVSARLRLIARPEGAGDISSRLLLASAGADGSFEIDGVFAGWWDLTAEAEGFQSGGREAIEVVTGETPEEILVVLRRGALVRGRVVGPDGEPVPAARVAALSASRPPFDAPAIRSVTTDSDGRYLLDGLPTRQISFSVEHPDYLEQTRHLDVRTGSHRLDFELEGGWEISGWVIDVGGRPVEGARVQARSPGATPNMGHSARAPVLSAADGSFTVRALPHGDYLLSAEKQGYAATQTEETVRVAGQSARGIELRLERGGAISGRVSGLEFDELSRVRVLALQPGRPAPPLTGQVDFEGRYRLEGLSWGKWMVLAVVGESGKNVQRGATLEAGGEDVILDLQFGGGLTLSGRVTRASEPVQGASVQATGTGTFSGSFAMTDPAGRFQLEGLDAGTYQVVVSGLADGLEQQEEIQLDSDREILIELRAYLLDGQVVDDLEGTPIEGAAIALTPAEQQGAGRASVLRTDAQGKFRLTGIAPGRYHLQARKQGYGNGSTEVEISANGEVPAVEMRLRPAAGLTLSVLHPSGAPAAEVSLMALDAAGLPVLAGRYDADEGGRIRLAELPAGSWTLLAAARGTATASQRVEVPGEPIRIRLPESGGLAVQVPALAGTRRLAQLTLRDRRGQPYRDAHTGQNLWSLIDGMATIPSLPRGDWTLEVRVAGEVRARTTVSRVDPGRILDVFVE